MLEKLIIRNFQKHKKLTIEFDKEITTIIGATDSGKSAVIRALRWVLTNKPQGNAFIRDGASYVSVTLLVDGHSIERRKGKGVNYYKLDGKEFHAFKFDVPPEITDVLNLSLINFQQQHDAPFWFSETAGEVNRQLNRIVNLHTIDDFFSVIIARLRKSKTELELTNEKIKAFEEAQEKTDYIPILQKDYEAMIAIRDKHLALAQQEENLQRITLKIDTARLQQEKVDEILKDWSDINSLASNVKEQKKVVDGLSRIISSYMDEERIAKIDIDTSVLEQLHKVYTKTVIRSKKLDQLVQSIEKREGSKCHATTEIEELEKEVFKLTKGKCPVCGTKMS